MAEIDVKNNFAIGDKIELMLPSGNQVFNLTHMENNKGEKIDVAPGSGHVVKIPIKNAGDLKMGLLLKFL